MGTASLRSRGPTCSGTASTRGVAAPVLAIGDGALGFWAALRDVFPATREQRCWFHKIANVLNAHPSPHSPARRPRWPRSGTPKTASTPRPLPAPSWPSTAPSGPGRSRRSPTTSTCCWSSTTTPPSTGSTCVPRTRSSRPSPPSAFGSGSPRARIACGRRGNGVQAHRVRPATVACRQRAPPRRSRPGRSPVREGPPGRTSRRIRRRSVNRMTRQSAGLDCRSGAREVLRTGVDRERFDVMSNPSLPVRRMGESGLNRSMGPIPGR